jgi:hypothetical protein
MMIIYGLGAIILLILGIIITPPVASTTPLFNSRSTTTLLYDNPNYGIQIRYPQDWAYIDSGTFFTGEPFAAVIFMPVMDALEFGMLLQESRATTEMPPTMVAVV